MYSFTTKLLVSFVSALILLTTGSESCGHESYLRAAYTDWFPYTFRKKGTPQGFELEIFSSILDAMGLKAVYENHPWERCLANLKQGKSDVLISMLKTPDRERFTLYPDEHISISKTRFFKKAGRRIAFDGDYQDLKDYRVGVIMGFSYGASFDQAEDLYKDLSINTRMLIIKLIKNRTDIAAENQVVAMATSAEMGMVDQIEFFGPPIHTQKLYVGFSKANHLDSLAQEFSSRLHQFKSSDRYRSILHRYGLSLADMTAHSDSQSLE